MCQEKSRYLQEVLAKGAKAGYFGIENIYCWIDSLTFNSVLLYNSRALPFTPAGQFSVLKQCVEAG